MQWPKEKAQKNKPHKNGIWSQIHRTCIMRTLIVHVCIHIRLKI